MPEQRTHAGEVFRAPGDLDEGVLLFYDDTGYIYLPGSTLKGLRAEFAGKTVTLETLRAHLDEKVGFKRDVSAHLAQLLVDQGAATRDAQGALKFPAP